jgi:hypothetical protein
LDENIMADTTTTNYGLVKPELKSVGWGEKINDDLDAIDAQMRLNEVSASDKVPLTRTVNSKALSANIVLTTADVADSADKRYCTDAQKTAIGTIPVKATGAEADTGTNDDKFLTAKAAKDSHNIPSVAPGTSGNVLTSDGTDWTSSAPATAGIESVVAGTNVTVDDTDPANPVVSATVTDASLTTTDVTTNNASTSKHGFLKKLSNVATEFMNGLGNWVSVTIDALLPSQTGNSGKFLTTNGSAVSWGSSSQTASVGDVLQISSDATKNLTIWTSGNGKAIGINFGGTLRIKFTAKHAGESGYCSMQIYRNSTPVGTLISNVGTETVYSEDIAGWSAGDLVAVYYSFQAADGIAYIKDFRIYADKYYTTTVVTP